MPAAFTTLKLRTADNATILDLVDGTNYALDLEGWAPSVAEDRASVLGGAGPIDEVGEVITLNVFGTSAAVALANVAALKDLLRRAGRFALQREGVAVLLDMQMQGSSLSAPLSALVLGGNIELPSDYNDRLMIGEIPGVTIRLTRRGAWLGPEVVSTTSASAQAPSVHTVTFADAPTVPSPVQVKLNSFVTGSQTVQFKGYIAVSEQASNIKIIEAESADAGSDGSTVADATPLARGGSIRRVTSGQAIYTYAISGGDSTIFRYCTILAAVRNNTAVAWSVNATLLGRGANAAGRKVWIDANDPYPQVINLGTLQLSADDKTTSIMLTVAPAAPGSSGGFDVDYIALIAATPNAAILGLNNSALPNTSATPTGLVIDPQPLSSMQAYVGFVDNVSVKIPISYQGDPVLQSIANTIAVAAFVTTTSAWRLNVGGTVISPTLTARRRPAYLTPQ